MDRAEATGFGIAAAGHLALLAALSLAFAASRMPPPKQQPIEVSFVEDSVPVSSAPTPSATEPAPKLAEVEGPPEPAAAPPQPAPLPPAPRAAPLPPPPRPQPPRPAPAPAPAAHKPVPAPAAHKPTPPAPQPRPTPPVKAARPPAPTPKAVPKPAPARPTGRLSGLLNGVSDRASPSQSASPPAATISAAVVSSLGAEVKRQLRPKWQQVVPSGADMDSLKTDLAVSLAKDGRVTHVEVVRTSGVTASNKPQVPLHQERAKKAVMLASPFHLPPEYYDAWKQVTVTLDLRLSQ